MASSNKLSNISIALFMTYRVSLQDWKEAGILQREIALYKELAKRFDTVYLITYGEADNAFQNQIPDGVRIVEKSILSSNFFYSLLLPLIHWRVFNKVDYVKTNQMKGSWSAVLVKYLYGSVLIIRTGYVLTQFANYQNLAFWKTYLYKWMERLSYNAADGIITSSPSGKKYVEKRYSPAATHHFIPNFIDIKTFRPMPDVEQREGICTVARLDSQKNLHALIDAVKQIDTRLTIVGEGPLRDELMSHAKRVNANVEFLGRMENDRIPRVINNHKAFVLASQYEGMPKALLEAMACGVAVVGTDVPGIRDVISDGEDGILCETNSIALREEIQIVLSNPDLRKSIGNAARQTIKSDYSLPSVVSSEISLYMELWANQIEEAKK